MREEGATEISGEERLPEERWKRVGMSGSLRGRRSEEMTQSNTLSEVLFEFQSVMVMKSHRMRYLEEGTMEVEKESVLLSVEEERIGGA